MKQLFLALTLSFSFATAFGAETDSEIPHLTLRRILSLSPTEVNWGSVREKTPMTTEATPAKIKDMIRIVAPDGYKLVFVGNCLTSGALGQKPKLQVLPIFQSLSNPASHSLWGTVEATALVEPETYTLLLYGCLARDGKHKEHIVVAVDNEADMRFLLPNYDLSCSHNCDWECPDCISFAPKPARFPSPLRQVSLASCSDTSLSEPCALSRSS